MYRALIASISSSSWLREKTEGRRTWVSHGPLGRKVEGPGSPRKCVLPRILQSGEGPSLLFSPLVGSDYSPAPNADVFVYWVCLLVCIQVPEWDYRPSRVSKRLPQNTIFVICGHQHYSLDLFKLLTVLNLFLKETLYHYDKCNISIIHHEQKSF